MAEVVANPVQAAVDARALEPKEPHRPLYEMRFVKQLEAMMAELNSDAVLAEHGMRIDVGFKKTKPESGEEGSNWGTSSYTRWGTVTLGVTDKRGETTLLANYRIESWDGGNLSLSYWGSPDTESEGPYARGFKFEGGREVRDSLEKVLKAVGRVNNENESLTTFPALLKEMHTVAARVAKFVRQRDALSEAAQLLQAAFPDEDLEDVVSGPLLSHVELLPDRANRPANARARPRGRWPR
jgi:hypothetical protein